jgi:hypothetical protein
MGAERVTMDGLNLRFRSSCLLMGILLTACGSPIKSDKNQNTPTYTPPTGSGTTPIGVSNTAGLALEDITQTTLTAGTPWTGVMHQADATYTQNLNGTGNPGGQDAGTTGFSNPCSVPVSNFSTAAADILCLLEVEELDLYFSPITLRYDVGPTCNYLEHNTYEFYDFQPGAGPNYVSHEVSSTGTVLSGVNYDTANNKALCQYDYSGSGSSGPNCCVGSYSNRVVTLNADGTTASDVTSPATWPGSVANCLSGPGMSLQPKDANGFPLALITQNPSQAASGFSATLVIPAAINSTNQAGGKVTSDIWAGNWYRGSQHVTPSIGGGPLPMRAPTTTGLPATLQFAPHPTYSFICMDPAQTAIARIRLMIRKWNQGPITEGDPNGSMELNVGTDPLGNPWDNRWGWATQDFGDSFPMSNE